MKHINSKFLKFVLLIVSLNRLGNSQSLSSNISNNTTTPIINEKNILEVNDSIYYEDDDDDFIDNRGLPSGSLFLHIDLFRDVNCSLYTGFSSTVLFEYPESCSCLNNNMECWNYFLRSNYFLNFNWTANFKRLYPEFPLTGNLNLSKCILESQNTTKTCISCQDLYFEYRNSFNYGKCVLLSIMVIIVIISFSALLFYCIYLCVFKIRRERREYNRIGIDSSTNSHKVYRFYTNNT